MKNRWNSTLAKRAGLPPNASPPRAESRLGSAEADGSDDDSRSDARNAPGAGGGAGGVGCRGIAFSERGAAGGHWLPPCSTGCSADAR